VVENPQLCLYRAILKFVHCEGPPTQTQQKVHGWWRLQLAWQVICNSRDAHGVFLPFQQNCIENPFLRDSNKKCPGIPFFEYVTLMGQCADLVRTLMATLATYGHLSASGWLYISFCWQGKVNSYTCTLCICAHSTIASLVGCDVLLIWGKAWGKK
jgi:hypothetical protein